jgi:hypothetical protein
VRPMWLHMFGPQGGARLAFRFCNISPEGAF